MWLIPSPRWRILEWTLSDSTLRVSEDDSGMTLVSSASSVCRMVTHCVVDWSEEQLRKHADEIRNSLGNYFLRITSNAIKRRAATVIVDPLPFCDVFSRQFPDVDVWGSWARSADLETCKLSTNEELLALLDGLGARVERAMRNFEVADALHSIVLVLRHVGCVF